MDRNEAVENFGKMENLSDRIGYAQIISYLFLSVNDMAKALNINKLHLRQWTKERKFSFQRKEKPIEFYRPRRPNNAEETKQIVEMISEHKAKGCAICNYSRSPRSLHFHHLDPTTKSFALSKAISQTLADVKKEIEKCIVVCANCHGEIHDGLVNLNKDGKSV